MGFLRADDSLGRLTTDVFGNPVSRIEDAPKGDASKEKDKNDDKKQEEENDDDKKDENKPVVHPKKKDPPKTATATPEAKSDDQKGDQVDQTLDSIKNPKSNEEALQHVSPEIEKKWRQAMAEAEKKGDPLNLYSNERISADLEGEYSRIESKIAEQIRSGAIKPEDGYQTLAQLRGTYLGDLAGAAFRDQSGFPDRWNAGSPFDMSGTHTPGFHLNDTNARLGELTRNTYDILYDSRPTPTLGSSGVSRLDVARQYSYYAMDHTTITQGNMGTCWTCSAEAMGWAWRPDAMSGAGNQILFTGRFESPFQAGASRSYSWQELMPTASNRAFDMNRLGGGEQSYVNKLDQVLIGNMAGNGAPWGGGDPGRASQAVFAITGLNGVPTQTGVGGLPGLVNGINNGSLKVVQYIPFSGHSASNSGRVLPTASGGFLGFGINDNSWGQSGENMFLATQGNIGQFKFPGGGGSMFGGLGGGASAINSILNGLQGGQQGGQQGGSSAAQQANVQQQADEYSKLDNNGKMSVRSVCVQAVTPGTKSLPHVCRLALTDKSLPPLFSGPGSNVSGAGITSKGGGTLKSF
jgi:hypothetical protein